MHRISFALVLFATAASAQPIGDRDTFDKDWPNPYASQGVDHFYELVVTDPNGGARFRSGYGSCLKGPIAFFDDNGNVQLKLDAGVDLPTGCSK